MLEKSNVIRPSGIAFSLMTALRNHCRKNHKLHFFSLFKKRILFKEFITSINISASAGMGEGESVGTRKQQKGRRNIQGRSEKDEKMLFLSLPNITNMRLVVVSRHKHVF